MQILRPFLPLVVIAISAASCTPFVWAQAASSPGSTNAHADLALPDDPSAPQTTTRAAADPSTAASDGVGIKRNRINPAVSTSSCNLDLSVLGWWTRQVGSAQTFTTCPRHAANNAVCVFMQSAAALSRTLEAKPQIVQQGMNFFRAKMMG